jgi:hypothetical protein
MGLRLRLGSIRGVALGTIICASGRQTLPKSGEYVVPGALGPLLIDREREIRIYRHFVLTREDPTASKENPICGSI